MLRASVDAVMYHLLLMEKVSEVLFARRSPETYAHLRARLVRSSMQPLRSGRTIRHPEPSGAPTNQSDVRPNIGSTVHGSTA